MQCFIVQGSGPWKFKTKWGSESSTSHEYIIADSFEKALAKFREVHPEIPIRQIAQADYANGHVLFAE